MIHSNLEDGIKEFRRDELRAATEKMSETLKAHTITIVFEINDCAVGNVGVWRGEDYEKARKEDQTTADAIAGLYETFYIFVSRIMNVVLRGYHGEEMCDELNALLEKYEKLMEEDENGQGSEQGSQTH